MSAVDTVSAEDLGDRLNPTCWSALEGALGLCMSRTNYSMEIEHWLTKLLEPPNTDLARLLRHFEIDPSRVSRDLTRSLDGLKTGNGRRPDLAPAVLDLMREAWVLCSLKYGARRIRSGHLLAALVSDRSLAAQLRSASPELAKIPSARLLAELPKLVAGSDEDKEAGVEPDDRGGGNQDLQTPALDQFTLDLTGRARAGEIDPVIGRDLEIRQMIDILTRRRQNNPILTGEAGVGKTAVVEGFAQRIVAGDVPPGLKGVAVRTLDLGLLQAGAGVKGEFENRLKKVIAEVKAAVPQIILFVDEAHTLIGAGGAAGQGDAANLLKPALARGELRTIAATTWAEYKKYFEKDAALKRRFQVVKVDEPAPERAILMTRGFAGTLEKHHKVRVLDEAVEGAVRLSHRYLPEQQLPDKAIRVLDTACARVALGQAAAAPALEDCRREVELLGVEIGVLERESLAGAEHGERLEELHRHRAGARERLAALEKRWAEESRLVEEICGLRARLEQSAGDGAARRDGSDAPAAEPKRWRADLARLQAELRALQGETPLVQPVVDAQAVAEVVSASTGIPMGKMVRDEIKTVLNLQARLAERIIGQDHALKEIAERVHTGRARLVDPRLPIGVFLLVGPSGVGKTETALALADILYGGDRNVVILNMSEYSEAINKSRLIGSAPGYVGYGEGGVLTEAVRRKPYSILLLDEIEKAHPSLYDTFLQVFGKGTLQDEEGQDVDFKNTIIFLTSNVGSEEVLKKWADPTTRPDDPAALLKVLQPELRKKFRPEFLGRLKVVPYLPLTDDVIRRIVQLQLGRVAARLRENHRASLHYDDSLVDFLAKRARGFETGARNVEHLLTGTVLPTIAREILARMAEDKPIRQVHVAADATDQLTYQVD